MTEITRGVIGMPYEMAMGSELCRRQFHATAQALLGKRDQIKAERELLQRAGESLRDEVKRLKAENEALRSHLQYLVQNEDNHDENQAERHMVITEAKSTLAAMAKEASHG